MEQELKELVDALKKIITPQGMLMSGNGILINAVGETNKILDMKVQKQLYFMEQRSQRMEEQNQEIISLLRAIAAKIK